MHNLFRASITPFIDHSTLRQTLTFLFMKTSTTLTILGVYQTLIGCMAMFFASSMAEMALAESYLDNANLVHLATNMHVGVGHAFFMIGILLLASRKADIAVAKTILIAYLIGIAAMFVVMNMVFGQSEVMNFSIEMVAPDMVFFVLAIYGYFKAK